MTRLSDARFLTSVFGRSLPPHDRHHAVLISPPVGRIVLARSLSWYRVRVRIVLVISNGVLASEG